MKDSSRRIIFWYQIVWLVLLALGAIFYLFWWPQTWPPQPINLGSIPLGVVWFGALGAVLISITGVVEHVSDWDPEFTLWHLSRPLIGASLAIVGVLILQAGILASGTQPASAPQGTPKNLLYYLVAFLVGYREVTFRELIKRLVDLIFTPAAAPLKPTITSLSPDTSPLAGGGSVKILGTGFEAPVRVSFGSEPATFTADSDGQISAVIPASSTAGRVGVTVKTKVGSATAPFTYT